FWRDTHTLQVGALFTGDGSVRLGEGSVPATWQVEGSISADEVEVTSNGTLIGPGAGGTNPIQIGRLIVRDNAAISNATLHLQNLQMLDQGSFSGSVISVANSFMMTGTNCALADTTLTLSSPASATFQPVAPATTAVLSLNQGAAINNLTGAPCDLQGANIFIRPLGSVGGTVNNAGTFLKSSGSGASSVACPFNNAGLLHVTAGMLSFESSWTQTAGSTLVDAGAVLAGSSLGLQGGVLSGDGTIAARVSNNAAVSPGGTLGILVVTGTNDYQQSASGTLVVELGGTQPGTQYDQLVVGGRASLAGQLELQFLNGFVPHPGDQF